MRLTKYTHACVRLTDGDRALVIDPGSFAEDAAFEGTTDFLVTHEHRDHLDPERLAKAVEGGARVHAHPAVVAKLIEHGFPEDSVLPISPGENRTVAGFLVEAVGGDHAEIYGGLPGCRNIGFLVDAPRGVVYHPGDSLFRPSVPVGTLLVPAAGPWLKLGEAIDFIRDVRPHHAHPIHDALLNEIGQDMADGWLGEEGKHPYSRIGVGDSVEV